MTTTWGAAKAAYVAAMEAEQAYDRDVFNPAYELWVRDNTPIPQEVEAEVERLQDLRYAAEDILMDIPSPTAADLVFKYQIAHGGGRGADCWNDMLEKEAARFVGADSAPSAVARAFERWKNAELASHYACVCPDHVMDHLTDIAITAFADLFAEKATSMEDLALKLFAVTVMEWEPKMGDPPLLPAIPDDDETYTADGWRKLIAEVCALAPAAAAASAEPHSTEFRRAA